MRTLDERSNELRFSPGVAKELRHYVYILIDPRNGHVFYVGKGQGDRIFAHVNADISNVHEFDKSGVMKNEDNEIATEESLKLQVIRGIRSEELLPIHIVHRHGMDEETAFQVEAALIDAFPGLTNEQSGHDSNEYGPANVSQLNKRFALTEIVFNPTHKLLIIKINQDRVEQNNGDHYATVRSSWRLNPSRAANAQYVLAVVGGVCKAVFNVDEWNPIGDRWEFNGTPAAEDIASLYVNKLIPKKYRKRGMAAPVLYVGF